MKKILTIILSIFTLITFLLCAIGTFFAFSENQFMAGIAFLSLTIIIGVFTFRDAKQFFEKKDIQTK